MSKVAWPGQEAKKIAKSIREPNKTVVFETGYGPSGLPHIGTFAEVVRTLFVMKALKESNPEISTKLIVFSDDMDGLRNLPENVPNHDMLKPHLGAPLSSIPDPFEKESSFAANMNGQLCRFLDSFDFEYEFQSSTAAYSNGIFDEGLKKVVDHYEEIRNLFTQTISPEKRAAWSPFFPKCKSCGKIYTTRVTHVDSEKYQLAYRCELDGNLYKSCGYEGVAEVIGGATKVGWKVDWALRWYMLGIDYEMYGKDLMESAVLSSKICRVLGGRPPVTYKYELFLDENGAKISKKIGNGISMDQWLQFAPIGTLLHFLLGNPNKAKRMGLPILPKLVDEYLQSLRHQGPLEAESSQWFIQLIQQKDLRDITCIEADISFNLLYNVAESLSLHDSAILFDYAAGYDEKVLQNKEFFLELCEKVVAYFKYIETTLDSKQAPIDSGFFPLLTGLKKMLEDRGAEEFHGEELQTDLFTIAKQNDRNPRDWFTFLYATLLGKEQGPKLGPFFAILGQEKSLSMIQGAIGKFSK